MVFPKARVYVSGALFAAWIAFLIFLVSQTRRPIILSRPQLLVADLIVLADLKNPNQFQVKKILWPADNKIEVGGIAIDHLEQSQGWREAGEYLIPLSRLKDNRYQVTELPDVPGYFPTTLTLKKLGPREAEVRKELESFTRWKPEELKKRLENLPMEWQPLATREEIERFWETLNKSQADLELRTDRRIYLATPEAMRQFDGIKIK